MDILMNTRVNHPFISFKANGEVEFYSAPFKEQMTIQGISIPAYLQETYGGKHSVKLGDPDFKRAFKEIYWKELDPTIFQWRWRENSPT